MVPLSITQPLKLLALGCSLITSSSLWFFDPSQIQTRSPSAEIGDHENLNLFDPVKKLEGRTGTPKSDSDFTVKSRQSGNILKFTLRDNDQEKTLTFSPFPKIDNLELKYVLGNKSFYTNLSKDSVNISLFKQPAWKEDSDEDVYGSQLSRDQINDLFKDLDETKTKQLLLSLDKKIVWKKNGNNNYYPQIHHQSSTNIDDLKSLKIKYFTDIGELKKYIKEKVESCTNPREACIAHLEELDLMNTDRLEFLQSSN